uniref:hypothetical protein n=1 Tax=Salmonella sp. s54836 TaxID=3159673 RepID=UPI003980D63A
VGSTKAGNGNVYDLGDACDRPGKSCLFFLTVPTVYLALEAVYLEIGLEVGQSVVPVAASGALSWVPENLRKRV